MRPVVLLDALQISVPMSCQEAPSARHCRLHEREDTRKCEAWLVAANERRRLKKEAEQNASILACNSKSSAPPASRVQEAEKIALPQPDLKHSEEHGVVPSQVLSSEGADAGSAAGSSRPSTPAGSTAGSSRSYHQSAQQLKAIDNVNVESRQKPSRAARGRHRDGQGQKGQKGGNNEEHRSGAHLQREDQGCHAGPGHVQFGEMQPLSTTPLGQQTYTGHQDAGFARSGQELAQSRQMHYKLPPGHAHVAGHDYAAALQSSGYANKGRELAQTHHTHEEAQPGSFAATGHGLNAGRQGFGHTGMARECPQPMTMHDKLPLSNVAATAEHRSYPCHESFAYGGKGQPFAQSRQGQMHENLPLSNDAAARHHFSANDQGFGYAVRRQDYAPAAITEHQFNAGHQLSDHVGRGRELVQSQRSTQLEDYGETPSPVNYLQQRYSNSGIAQSGPSLPYAQGRQDWHLSNTRHITHHNQAHWSANSSSWQQQSAQQQQQQPVQNYAQFTQPMQATQPTQNTQHLETQPIQRQSQAISDGYGDAQLESMLLTQFQPLESRGHELDDSDFEY
eukprot:TRINITY_DN58360_c0_g1_i1.p1 TRINITY_DN58360_c0_g1~~TRINITY_DN58360_c0_g1_i1.p1  ORF type:complete len:589 (-),score=83.50 TRINITY_DN58360_c0_g1_i1:833-2527(-)